ncbi:MAG: HAD hydrolase family protein [Desulfomicrobiaceae bacterium]|jgi:3-deoxy-D-manno-octulosonate 8-phosphate phosphatase (KDO 8-P phosphatase)
MPHSFEIPAHVAEAARKVRLLVLDVDGVLTDGGLYYDAHGHIQKRFHVHDGLGIKMALHGGLQIAVITGLDSAAVRARVTELGIPHYYPGFHRKMDSLARILADEGLEPEQAAYLGDDLVDLAPMRTVGLPLAVPNARPEVLTQALWVTPHSGGHGAVRDAVELILRAQGNWESICAHWTNG